MISATVVKVPPGELEAFHKFNQHMCMSDALLPSFSSEMRYALLTKNHLAHAIKLYAGGAHLLHGTSEPIKPSPGDQSLQEHLSEGIFCEVSREETWADKEGMQAICGETTWIPPQAWPRLRWKSP